MNLRKRGIRIRDYNLHVILIVISIVLFATIVRGAYMWAARTVDVSVEEPLTITSFPTTVRTHPGQNQTLDITIENNASVTYRVALTFTLGNITYQTQYVTFSNYTYMISPATNQITAWMITDPAAPNMNLQLTVQFYRE